MYSMHLELLKRNFLHEKWILNCICFSESMLRDPYLPSLFFRLCIDTRSYVICIAALMSLESKRLYLIPHLSKNGATKLKQLLLHMGMKITLVRCLG